MKTGLTLCAAFGALALASCGGGSGDKTRPTNGASVTSQYETATDHAIGNPAASVTVVEYASVVCGHCANWHEAVYPDLKKAYIDSGKIRYIFREFPTAPANLARAGFMIANCADETKFFENISLQFRRQKQIFKAANAGTARDEYINIAKSAGLSEADFNACLQDEEEIARYEAVVQSGNDAGVTGTPSFFVNGEKISRTESGASLFTLESFAEVLDPLLGEVKTQDDAEDSETSDSEPSDSAILETVPQEEP